MEEKNKKKLEDMALYHREQSGFSADDAPPTPEAYRENKRQYDKLSERVQGCDKKYNHLRKEARAEEVGTDKKSSSDKQRQTDKVREVIARATHVRKFI